MDFRKEIKQERKKYLKLEKTDTKRIYDLIINFYKEKIIIAPRNVVDYSIDIIVCNMNYYNRLGKVEELNERWGDSNFYVDLNNSVLVPIEVQDDGTIESFGDNIEFKENSKFQEIDNTSFSIKEMIELCQRDNLCIRLCSKDDEFESCIEIVPNRIFEMNENIKKYLDTLKK